MPRLPRWLPFEWIVALRFLREGRTQTMFIIGGIAIGVGVIVFMSALLSALQANFVVRALTGQAHIQLLPPKEQVRPQAASATGGGGAIVQAPLQRLKSLDQWQAVAAQIRTLPGVVVVSPVVSGGGLGGAGGRQPLGVGDRHGACALLSDRAAAGKDRARHRPAHWQ